MQARQSSVSFTVYRLDTGQIVRTGQCPLSDVAAQANRAGIGVLAEWADPETQFVMDDRVTNLPPKPCDDAEFDFDAHVWRDLTAGVDVEAKHAKEEAAAYLAATDWYVTRLVETGKPVPTEVTAARAAARESTN